jgi:ethanolamine utilization protein EutP
MRMIFIGRSMAGKTTLCQYLNEEDLNYHKTQTVQVVNGEVIDTPGEYLEQAYLRGALSVSAADANLIVLVQAANEKGTMFSPGFSSRFAKPCIGIVTKSDLGTEKQISNATKYLQIAGARKVFVTSSYEGKGFKELITYFDEKKDEFALTKRVTVK